MSLNPSRPDTTTFASQYDTEFKHTYANQLEHETGQTTETDVEITTTIPQDNVKLKTTADIVLYDPNGPHTIINLTIDDTPPEPTTPELALTHAHMQGLATDNTHPPAAIVAIGIKTNTLQKHPFEFSQSSWENLYKLMLTDIVYSK